MAEELWYFLREGQPTEPVTAAELKRLASAGDLRGGDLVWSEGMADWDRADSVPGLLADASSEAIQPQIEPWRLPAKQEAEKPRRARRLADSDDDWPPRRPAVVRRGRRLRRAVIGVMLVGLAMAGGGALIAGRSGSPRVIATYDVALAPRQFHAREFPFKFGTLYEFRVTSDAKTNVDLLIENEAGQLLSGDITIGPNSLLQWSPIATGTFRVRIENQDDGEGNQSHVEISSVSSCPGPVNNGALNRADLNLVGNAPNP